MFNVDLNDFVALDTVLNQVRPDVVVHSAWAGLNAASRSNRTQITDNIQVAVHLTEASASYAVKKFIGLGSQGEYGLHLKQMTEFDLPNPTSLYGAAKLAVYELTKQLAAQAGMDHAWVRLFSTYGPGDNSHWLIPSMIDQIIKRIRPKTTLGEQQWDFLYIEDVAAAILSIASTPAATGVFNLGSGKTYRVRSVIEQIRDIIAPDFELQFGDVPYSVNQIWTMQADIRRLQSCTDWKPVVGIDTGLGLTIDWHRMMDPKT